MTRVFCADGVCAQCVDDVDDQSHVGDLGVHARQRLEYADHAIVSAAHARNHVSDARVHRLSMSVRGSLNNTLVPARFMSVARDDEQRIWCVCVSGRVCARDTRAGTSRRRAAPSSVWCSRSPTTAGRPTIRARRSRCDTCVRDLVCARFVCRDLSHARCLDASARAAVRRAAAGGAVRRQRHLAHHAA
jgi:hypothetical protein